MSLRIDNTSQIRASSTDSYTLHERQPIDFKKTLLEIQTTKNKELEKFLLHIENLGKRLAKTLSINDLEEFRNTVKAFLQSTFGQSSKMQEEVYWDLRGQAKVLARINKINRALDELGQQIINSYPKPLDVLKKIDQIRGLILDLFA